MAIFDQLELKGVFTALVKVGFCNLKCFTVMYRSEWAVSRTNMIEQTPYYVNKIKIDKLIK